MTARLTLRFFFYSIKVELSFAKHLVMHVFSSVITGFLTNVASPTVFPFHSKSKNSSKSVTIETTRLQSIKLETHEQFKLSMLVIL